MVIKKKYHFYAGHRNKSAGEKCGRMHGHTYEVIVVLEFPEFEGDVAMLFGDIDAICEPVIKSFDHYFLLHEDDALCDALELMGEPFIRLPFETSAENMARHIFSLIDNELMRKHESSALAAVELAETKSSNVIHKAPRL